MIYISFNLLKTSEWFCEEKYFLTLSLLSIMIMILTMYKFRGKKSPNRPYSQLLPSLHTLFRTDGIKV